MKNRSPKWTRSLFGSLCASTESFKVDGDRFLNRVATDLYEALDTPVSLSCEILLRYGEIKELCSKTIHPAWYSDPLRFRDDYQAVSFLKKVPFKNAGLKPQETAHEKFLLAEQQCKETNQRIRQYLLAPERASDVAVVIETAGRKIKSLLGSLDYESWLHACRFGPGVFKHPEASGLTSVYDKLQVSPSVTFDFLEPAVVLLSSAPWWARSVTGVECGLPVHVSSQSFSPVPGNRVAFVPKTAITHRAIAIEPLMNIYAQLGLGKLLRRKLKLVGIDLDDQTPNQRMAYQGSIDGSLCTIDLSSASDTVAKELVRHLIPDEWFAAMDACRSKVGELDGRWILYEKFSSMGNGFTFELESLIFWGLAAAACEVTGAESTLEVLRVYGDDIIIPVRAYETLKKTLEFCGFSLNTAKSFSTGPFRESCGKDYYDGHDVRPLFLKEVPERVPSLFTLANRIRRLAHRRCNFVGCDRRLFGTWKRIVSELPKSISNHVRVPAHAGDPDGIVSNWDEAQRSSFVVPLRGGWEGYSGLRLQSIPVLDRLPTNFYGGVASLLYRQRDGSVSSDSSSASPRQGRVSRYQLRDGAVYGPWTDLGPWF